MSRKTITIEFTESELFGIILAMSNCLESGDEQDRKAVFGKKRQVNAAWNANDKIGVAYAELKDRSKRKSKETT